MPTEEKEEAIFISFGRRILEPFFFFSSLGSRMIPVFRARSCVRETW